MRSRNEDNLAPPSGSRVPAWAWTATFVVLLAAVVVLLWKVRSQSGDPAPRFLDALHTLSDQDDTGGDRGNTQALHVLVIFRYTDCPPCLGALESIQTVVDNSLVFSNEEDINAVVVGSGYTRDEALQIARAHGWMMPVIGDPEGEMSAALQGAETPLVLLIDPRDRPRTLLEQGPAMLPVEQAALASQLERAIQGALDRVDAGAEASAASQ